jgi:hypothetical protein
MPALAAQQALDFDRYIPKIERIENENYNELAKRAFGSVIESKFLEIKYGLIDADVELKKLARLTPGWDSYGAESPSAAAIDASRRTLRELAVGLILPSSIVPSAGGGVSIYFMDNDRTAYIENYNDGTQALVMYDLHGHTDVLEIGNEIQMAEVSGRISTYLG